jgi:hypothetical protein
VIRDWVSSCAGPRPSYAVKESVVPQDRLGCNSRLGDGQPQRYVGGTGFDPCSGSGDPSSAPAPVTLLSQERTKVRMARSATDSSAKSHVPVASIAASVVRSCANPSEFSASQRSASSLGLP